MSMIFEKIREGYIIEKDGCYMTVSKRNFAYDFYKTTSPITCHLYDPKPEAGEIAKRTGGRIIHVRRIQTVTIIDDVKQET